MATNSLFSFAFPPHPPTHPKKSRIQFHFCRQSSIAHKTQITTIYSCPLGNPAFPPFSPSLFYLHPQITLRRKKSEQKRRRRSYNFSHHHLKSRTTLPCRRNIGFLFIITVEWGGGGGGGRCSRTQKDRGLWQQEEAADLVQDRDYQPVESGSRNFSEWVAKDTYSSITWKQSVTVSAEAPLRIYVWVAVCKRWEPLT